VLNSHASQSVISVPHHIPLIVCGFWLLPAHVKTTVSLQLLQTRCVVIRHAMNRSRQLGRVSVGFGSVSC